MSETLWPPGQCPASRPSQAGADRRPRADCVCPCQARRRSAEIPFARLCGAWCKKAGLLEPHGEAVVLLTTQLKHGILKRRRALRGAAGGRHVTESWAGAVSGVPPVWTTAGSQGAGPEASEKPRAGPPAGTGSCPDTQDAPRPPLPAGPPWAPQHPESQLQAQREGSHCEHVSEAGMLKAVEGDDGKPDGSRRPFRAAGSTRAAGRQGPADAVLRPCAPSPEGSRGAFGRTSCSAGRGPLCKDTAWTWGQGSFVSVAWASYLPAGLLTERAVCAVCGHRPCWGHIPGAVHHRLGFQSGSRGGRRVQVDSGSLTLSSEAVHSLICPPLCAKH